MLATNWRERANDVLATRFANASGAMAHGLHDANDALARHGEAGLERARALGHDTLDRAHRAGRSTQRMVAGHPVESMLLAGLAGVVIGWMLRHALRRREQAAASSRTAARTAPRRSAAKGATQPARRASRNGASKSP